jgi:hypothetical protein
MSAAVRTFDLDSSSIGIRNSFDTAFDVIVKCRPAAVCIELGFCGVEGIIASSADIGSVFIKIIILLRGILRRLMYSSILVYSMCQVLFTFSPYW